MHSLLCLKQENSSFCCIFTFFRDIKNGSILHCRTTKIIARAKHFSTGGGGGYERTRITRYNTSDVYTCLKLTSLRSVRVFIQSRKDSVWHTSHSLSLWSKVLVEQMSVTGAKPSWGNYHAQFESSHKTASQETSTFSFFPNWGNVWNMSIWNMSICLSHACLLQELYRWFSPWPLTTRDRLLDIPILRKYDRFNFSHITLILQSKASNHLAEKEEKEKKQKRGWGSNFFHLLPRS